MECTDNHQPMPEHELLWHSIDQHQTPLTELSEQIWGFAETRFEEFQSAQAIWSFLQRNDFAVTTGVAGIETAFTATFGYGEPHIGFLGEYDALSGLSQHAGEATPHCVVEGGNGHGCGHHLLGVASVGAALAIKHYLETHQLSGTVTFYGCPAEEGGSGKTFMVRDGVFADLDAAITWHPHSFSGVFNTPTLANIQAEFHFHGKASHAAAAPHIGRSALDSVELMNVGANYLREHIPQDSRLHYAITLSGGLAPNVVQSEASVLYLMRSPRVADVQDIYTRIQAIAQGAALMAGTNVDVEFIKACSSYQPNRYLELLMARHIETLGMPSYTDSEQAYLEEMRGTLTKEDIKATVDHLCAMNRDVSPSSMGYLYDDAVMHQPMPYKACFDPLYGSTDVGDVSWVVPTVQCYAPCYAFGTPLHTWQAVSQGNTSVGYKGMVHAAKVMAATALDLLLEPTHIKQAKAELEQELQRAPYLCPIPQGVVPRS